jgi:hypothetical protein
LITNEVVDAATKAYIDLYPKQAWDSDDVRSLHLDLRDVLVSVDWEITKAERGYIAAYLRDDVAQRPDWTDVAYVIYAVADMIEELG